MTQSRLSSFIEAIVNTAIGFTINWIANLLILPMFGFNVTAGQAFNMGLLFTVISVVRGYAIRRWFNQYIHKMAMKVVDNG